MTSLISRPARVGLITDQTGALSFMGVANVNLAKMVTDDINAHGGLLGRPVELYVEDSATDDEIAHTAAARLVREADVDVVIGGIYSSTRQAIKRPVVDEAAKLYIYPEQYEGQESHPLIFCTGPVPAQQLDPFIPWLMRQTGAGKFYMPSADYIWPHTLNKNRHDCRHARRPAAAARHRQLRAPAEGRRGGDRDDHRPFGQCQGPRHITRAARHGCRGGARRFPAGGGRRHRIRRRHAIR